jgi:hypothetical protein
LSQALDGTEAEELLADGCCDLTGAIGFTGLSRSQLYVEMQSGALLFVKVGRRTLIPRRALIRFLAERLRGAR